MKFLKPIKITQRNVDLSAMWLLIIASTISVLSNAIPGLFNSAVFFSSAVMAVINGIILYLYKKGHEVLGRVLCIFFVCFIVVVSLYEPYLTQQFSFMIYVCALLGMMLLNRPGLIAAGVGAYLGALIKAGFTGAYADVTGVLLYIVFLGFVTIISFRFDTEKSYVEEEEAKLRASITSFPRGYILTDLKGAILVSNKLIETIFNLVRKPKDLNDIQKQLGESLNLLSLHSTVIEKKESIVINEVAYSGKFLRLLLSPIYITNKEIIGVVILVEDLTEERVMQRSKDEFFSIASHELRTPLTAIRGNASMMKDYYAEQLKDPDFKLMLDDIHDSSVRLITIVNDFLAMSRLEQGQMTFNKVETNLGEIIEASIKEVRNLAEEKKIPINVKVPEDKSLLELNTDIDRIKEVFINLLGNSIRFTDKGGIIIRAKKEDKFLKISIEDTGSGIPLKNQSLLFRKFQQASDNILTRDTTRSTGLGLYISKLIVESLGGEIYLEKSEEGKGSVFTFTLPIN